MTEHTTGPLSSHRQPTIDVGNGHGFIEVFEVSKELQGGDWYDVAYCFSKADAVLFSTAPELLAHCQRILGLLERNNGNITQTQEAINQQQPNQNQKGK
jgi:hypothetical protein